MSLSHLSEEWGAAACFAPRNDPLDSGHPQVAP
jgi:hypothetical protein